MSELLRRYNSNAQSYAVLVALASGKVSEGQAVKLLGMDRLSVRECTQECLDVARELWEQFRESGETIQNLRNKESVSRHFLYRDSD